MEINIVNITSDDVKELYNCNKTVLPIYYYKDQYLEFINDFDHILLKAVDKDNIFIGYIIGRRENKKRFHILSFGVYKQFRRQKVGSLLMSEIEKHALNKFDSIQFISLNVITTNHIGIKFYENCGFKKVRLLEHYYGLNEHGFTYGKNINMA
jgi:ribosomal-protein-alanine N-acetyltransferase